MNKDEKCIKNNCSACQEWLKASEQNSNKINYLSWILGGIGVVSLIGIAVYFVIRKERRR